MLSVDVRTRSHRDGTPLEPGAFLDEQVGPLLEAHGVSAGRAARRLGLAPLTFDIEGERMTWLPGEDAVEVRAGSGGTLIVGLDRAAFSDLIQDSASTFGLYKTGRAVVRQGGIDAFVAWEPVLRCLLDGRAVYEPGSIGFTSRDGSALDLRRSFTLADDPAEIGHFLAQAGFLHIAGLFTAAEMAAVSAEFDAALATAERGDGASWWARTEPGGWYPARILGFDRQSPALRELLRGNRFARLATFTDDRYRHRDPDAGDTAEGLLKKIGVVEGASDVSWHKDCTMGGHSYNCCGLVVGISVTGAGPESGELGVVAGSHRANVSTVGLDGLDLPRLPLPTRIGDVTVHCSCTLHMSRPPISGERRVVYTGFSLAPRADDIPVEIGREEIRRRRAALNDMVGAGQSGSRLSDHEL
ncbi:phytanoyl-CoA dioxygenase family protein [Nocardia sp. BMG111209]|uniref:phytanoyl-CoA dioxygenase family protein n=1 Tax=Nocardia sp. BMG111209 TaxID=1160137 RepID=UPI000380DE34|nr:phytanoyl-CoA dioxygenase family protein [Nocardia sp. BMG111209]